MTGKARYEDESVFSSVLSNIVVFIRFFSQYGRVVGPENRL